nr:hypothetical protein [Dyella sp. ASV24]
MKLILCPMCEDVVKLNLSGRFCDCGQSWGRYMDDGINAEIAGDAIPIGFANSELRTALTNRPRSGMGCTFSAFVIPEICDTVRVIRLPFSK